MKYYIEHKNKVVVAGKRFRHVMAVALNPASNYSEGVIRCIVSRKGDLGVGGAVDKSILYKFKVISLTKFEITEPLKIKNQKKILSKLEGKDFDLLGFEDPDIWKDSETGLIHLYFTMPFLNRKKKKHLIHLGHAVGKDLNSLVMTEPSVLANKNTWIGAKELCVAPVNKKGFRYNLVESSSVEKDESYSVVTRVISKNMGSPWKMDKVIFHPKEHKISWIGGHASPGPLFPKTFIDVGEGKILGIMNGCKANKKIKGVTIYGTFSIGLFIYDYENGKINWVSKKPLIRDSTFWKNKSRSITFASDFVETKQGEGILYAHVDDSFIRAYDLKANLIKKLIPKKYLI